MVYNKSIICPDTQTSLLTYKVHLKKHRRQRSWLKIATATLLLMYVCETKIVGCFFFPLARFALLLSVSLWLKDLSAHLSPEVNLIHRDYGRAPWWSTPSLTACYMHEYVDLNSLLSASNFKCISEWLLSFSSFQFLNKSFMVKCLEAVFT